MCDTCDGLAVLFLQIWGMWTIYFGHSVGYLSEFVSVFHGEHVEGTGGV